MVRNGLKSDHAQKSFGFWLPGSECRFQHGSRVSSALPRGRSWFFVSFHKRTLSSLNIFCIFIIVAVHLSNTGGVSALISNVPWTNLIFVILLCHGHKYLSTYTDKAEHVHDLDN